MSGLRQTQSEGGYTLSGRINGMPPCKSMNTGIFNGDAAQANVHAGLGEWGVKWFKEAR